MNTMELNSASTESIIDLRSKYTIKYAHNYRPNGLCLFHLCNLYMFEWPLSRQIANVIQLA